MKSLARNLFVFLFALFSSGTWAQSSPPNIVYIMVDDLSTWETTPTTMPKMFQYIANQGVENASFYAPQSLCCPSRSTQLTGRSAHNMGMHSNLTEFNIDLGKMYYGGAPWFRYLGLDQDTVATRMKAGSNYMTAWTGVKYLNDFPKKIVSITPTEVNLIPEHTYVPPGWDYWYSASIGSHTGYNNKFNRNGVLDAQGTNANNYNTDLVFNEAKVVIDLATAQNKPLFLNITTNAPHSPFPPPYRHADCMNTIIPIPSTPNYLEANYADKAPPIRRAPLTNGQINNLQIDHTRRLCSLKAIDEGIESLINHLAQVPGRLENTFVIFTSDNGFAMGQHRYYGKSVPYEVVSRLPFYVRGPGVPGPEFPGSRKISALTSVADLPVTFLDIAGVAPGPLMEGRSIKQGFTRPSPFNNGGNTRQMLLLEGLTSATPVAAGGTGECSIPPAPTAASSSEYIAEYDRARRNFWGLRTKRYTYVKWCNSDGSDHRELYDNLTDRWQTKSLLPQPDFEGKKWRVGYELPQAVNPAFLAELDDRINGLKTCTGPACKALEDAPLVNTPY